MLFELLSGLRLVHACTFFDGGGDGSGGDASDATDATDATGANAGLSPGDVIGVEPGSEADFSTNTPDPNAANMEGPAVTSGELSGSETAPGQEGLTPGEIGPASDKNLQQMLPATEQPIAPPAEKLEEHGDARATRQAKRRRKSILSRGDEWTVYAGRKKALLGE